MAYLMIETSTDRGFIACLDKGSILFSKELPFGLNQSRHLMPELDILLKQINFDPRQLSCIGVGVGPGSYTGIRIGAAVAQALAFSWNIPLVGVSSLNGFVPASYSETFAAIIDARIGGAYVRTGKKEGDTITYLSGPEVCPLEELGARLKGATYFVTPNSGSLRTKLAGIYPEGEWQWEERHPCIAAFGRSVEAAFLRGEAVPAGKLDLLYLRKTEAEREKEKRQM